MNLFAINYYDFLKFNLMLYLLLEVFLGYFCFVSIDLILFLTSVNLSINENHFKK